MGWGGGSDAQGVNIPYMVRGVPRGDARPSGEGGEGRGGVSERGICTTLKALTWKVGQG